MPVNRDVCRTCEERLWIPKLLTSQEMIGRIIPQFNELYSWSMFCVTNLCPAYVKFFNLSALQSV